MSNSAASSTVKDYKEAILDALKTHRDYQATQPGDAKFKVPLYNTAEIPLSSNYIVRKTSWTGMMKPNRPLSANGLITFT